MWLRDSASQVMLYTRYARDDAKLREILEGERGYCRLLANPEIPKDERVSLLREAFGGLCCEMEGASIAHVCHLNGVPFVIVRAISDKANGSSSVDYPTFEREAAHHCASITARLVEILAAK